MKPEEVAFTNLKAHKLNLKDALALAFIVEKYANLSIADPIDFIESIVGKIQPSEYLECVRLITKQDKETIKNQLSLNILTVFIEGLKLNKIVNLVKFYQSLIA